MNRREFVSMVAAATLVRPKFEQAELRRVQVLRGGVWREEPDGLRRVHAGERFRVYEADRETIGLEAVAESDGFETVDQDGLVCGACYYYEDAK